MKNVLVTGASRGLGLEIARRLAADGAYKVIGVGRSRPAEMEALLAEHPERFRWRSHDLSDVAGHHALVRAICADEGPLYGLVNNAASGFAGVLGTAHDRDIADTIRLNLESPIVLAKYAVRSMLLAGSGRVVNIASIAATTGFNGLSVYGATKAGLAGFTRSLARELGKAKITVNTVAPGYMETAMTVGIGDDQLETIRRRTPAGRLAAPGEVASVVAYLLSEEAAMVNGAYITVDGGSSA